MSNCVVNLSPNKKDVFKEAYRVLKPGGEMYFSDVYSDRRIPEKLLHDPILHGECLSGALYWNDFLSLVKTVGFKSPRLVKDRPLSITNKDIEKLIGFAKFYSATYRLFKIAEFDNTDGEDYGLKIKYKGTIETCPDIFILDKEKKQKQKEAEQNKNRYQEDLENKESEENKAFFIFFVAIPYSNIFFSSFSSPNNSPIVILLGLIIHVLINLYFWS